MWIKKNALLFELRIYCARTLDVIEELSNSITTVFQPPVNTSQRICSIICTQKKCMRLLPSYMHFHFNVNNVNEEKKMKTFFSSIGRNSLLFIFGGLLNKHASPSTLKLFFLL